jgi:UrcA family protein
MDWQFFERYNMNSSASIRVIAGVASVLATIGIGAMVAGPASHAALPEVTPLSVRVRFGDLDLSKPDGVNALKTRIGHAARQVCDQADARDLEASVRFNRCVNEATAQAFAKVGLVDR